MGACVVRGSVLAIDVIDKHDDQIIVEEETTPETPIMTEEEEALYNNLITILGKYTPFFN